MTEAETDISLLLDSEQHAMFTRHQYHCKIHASAAALTPAEVKVNEWMNDGDGIRVIWIYATSYQCAQLETPQNKQPNKQTKNTKSVAKKRLNLENTLQNIK